MNFPKIFLFCEIVFYCCVPVVLICLPKTYFDVGQSVCLSVVLFKMECYGCGMTRALMHLLHGDIADALYYNALSFIVFPMLLYVWAKAVIECYQKIRIFSK